MGMFSYRSNFVTESMIDMSSIEAQECFEENAMDSAYRIVAENTANWNSIMEAIGIDELAVYESTGYEMVYEAGTISSIFEKFKDFFKKLLEKIKGIFAKFMTVLNSWTKSEKEFVKKYKMDILKANMEDFEFKGYKFTIETGIQITPLGDSIRDSAKTTMNEDIDKIINAYCKAVLKDPSNSSSGNKYDSRDSLDAMKALAGDKTNKTEIEERTKAIKDKKEDIIDAYRGAFIKGRTTNSAPTNHKIDSEDFSRELFEAARNGQSEKEILDEKDIEITECLQQLETFEKDKKDAEKAYRLFTKGIQDSIKELEDYNKELGRAFPKEKGNEQKGAMMAFISTLMGIAEQHKSIATIAYGAYIQAIKDRNRQNKAICVKVLTRKQPKNESSTSWYEEGSSMLSSVSLK